MLKGRNFTYFDGCMPCIDYFKSKNGIST